jgi:predicted RNase H-like nuclease (RuvC/YqgF family)
MELHYKVKNNLKTNNMKKIIFTLALTTLVGGATLSSCQSSATKVKNAEKTLQKADSNVVVAKANLNATRQDSVAEYQAFKKTSEERISANEKSITDFKAKMANDKKEFKAKNEKHLTSLEQKNNDMKMRLENYKDEGQIKWLTFKNGFNRDMDKLGNDIKNFSVKIVK